MTTNSICSNLKKILAIVLTLIICSQVVMYGVSRASAESKSKDRYLESAQIPQELLDSKDFYLGSANGELEENYTGSYILKVGRGGDAKDEAKVDLKISDFTAKYGKDYIVRIKSDSILNGKEANNPEDNESVFEMIDGESVLSEQTVASDEEKAELLQNLSSNTSLALATPDQASAVRNSSNPLKSAKEEQLGEKSDRADMTSSKQDMVDVVNNATNMVTSLVKGATLTVNFEKGEKEKYVEIVTYDNKESDGDRVFYINLSKPTETYYCGKVCEAAITIKDDEPAEDAVISFEKAKYNADENSVTVVVKRSGAVKQVATAKMTSESITAKSGIDFQPVNADVIFPMGIKERTLTLDVTNAYINSNKTFALKLSTETEGVKIGDNAKTVVTIKSPKNNETVTPQAETARKITDTDYTSNYDFYKDYNCVKVRGSSDYWNTASDGYLRLRAEDKKYLDVKVSTSGTSRFTDDYCYDGIRLHWEKISARPSWTKGNIAVYTQEVDADKRQIWSSGSERWDLTYDNYLFGWINVSAVKFYLMNDGGNRDYLDIHSMQFIKRHFYVNVENADSLSYLTGDGDKTAANDRVVRTKINGLEENQRTVIKYADEEIVVSVPQDTQPYSNLTGLKLKKQNGSYIDIPGRYYTTNGGTALTFRFNRDFINTYHDEIKFTPNGNRYVGNLTIKPVFSYIDSKITVKPNETFAENNDGAVPGHLTINGKVIDTGKSMSEKKNVTLTYHAGDTLNFSTKMYDDIRYRAVSVNKKYLDRQTGTYKDVDDFFSDDKVSTVIEGVSYDIMPNFGLADNTAMIVISKDDLNHFERSGMLSSSFINSATLKNGYYYIKAIKPEQMRQNMEYLFNVKPLEGYQPVWRAMNNANYYQTQNFTYRPTSKKDENIVYLFAGKESDDYVSMKGQLYYENYMISGKKIGYPIMPIKDGGVDLNGELFMTDKQGNISTKAVHPVASIVDNGKTVEFGKGKTTLYSQARMISAWRAENYNFAIDYSGTKQKVSNGKEDVDSYVVDFGKFTLDTNSEYGPTAKDIFVKNAKDNVDQVIINGSPTTIKVSFSNIPKEGIKKVQFHILDAVTFEKKASYDAMESADGNYSIIQMFNEDGVSAGDYQVGDLVYVQVTTNEELGFDTSEEDKRIKETTYAPIYTGYVLSRTDVVKEPIVQTLDFGDIEGYKGFPIVGDFKLGINLGRLTLTTENLYDNEGKVIGTRIQANMKLDYDWKLRKASETHGKDIFGKPAKTLLQKLGDIQGAFEGAASSLSKIRSDAKAAGSYKEALKGVAGFGKPDWAIVPVAGIYLDFGYKCKYDENNKLISKKLIFMGGGVYFGVSASFKVAWYALIPVAFIPVYFGVGIDGRIATETGITTSVDMTEEETEYENYIMKSHNIAEQKHGDFKLVANASIDIYAGVGICCVVGVRGGIDITGGFIWYPTLAAYNDYFKAVGGSIGANFAIWFDLVLFTIPVKFNLAHKEWGLSEQYAKLKDKTEDEIQYIINNRDKSVESSGSSGTTEYGDVQLKDRSNTPSAWNGDVNSVSPGEVKTMATYKEKSTSILLRDGYDRPDTKLLDMGAKGTLMVFLQDNKSKSDEERTSICYSVYKDGRYSKPVVIQNDSTADFEPNVTDASDKVIITWTSSDPDIEKISIKNEKYSKEYLKSLEVYCVEVDKDDLVENKSIDQESIKQLTSDNFYDSQAYAVYDKTSGDYNIYYIKTAEDDNADADLFDFANPMNTSKTTYSTIAYRVNEKGKGWLVDEFEVSEKPSKMTDDEFKDQLKELNGQRLLDSGIDTDSFKINDPLIADFKAIGYNGIGVFTYTIDKDNNVDTVDDRDLFIQLYDFKTRKTYEPIRITEDSTADALPQLVRNGSDENGTTYLFWLSADELKYVDISSLVKYGIDKNGKIKSSVLDNGRNEKLSDKPDENIYDGMTEEEIKKETYKFEINKFVPADVDGENEKPKHSLSSYEVAVDKDDNLYVIWIEDPEGTEGVTQEVFASAMVTSEIKSETDENVSKSWSCANQLTNSGLYCDEPAIAITEDNEMMMVYNRFDVDKENTTYKDMNLVSTILEPYGSVEATEIEYSDNNPNVGDDIDISINFKNTGLTVCKDGFVAKVYERQSDGTKRLLETMDFDSSLVPNNCTVYSFTYKVNEKTVGSDIYVTVKEKDLDGTTINCGEKFVNKAEYEITNYSSYQGDDGKFYSDVTFKNVGNCDSDNSDVLKIMFNGQYGDAASYGVTNAILADQKICAEVGKSKTVTLSLDIPTEAMTKYGFADICALIYDKDENELAYSNCTMFMEKPTDLKINSGKDINVNKGDSIDLKLDYQTNGLLKPVTPVYEVEDNSVVTVKGNKLVAVGSGTTTVKVLAMPYNSNTEIKVTVGDNKVKSITLSKSKISSLYTGKTYKLTAKVNPANANQSVKWSSSNTKIATVDSKGKITAKKAGKVKITATSKENSKIKAVCTVTVKQKAKSVKLNKSVINLKKDKKYQLKVTVLPKDTTNKAVKFKSSDKKVATVSNKGKITVKGKGYAYITAITKDGSKKSAKTLVVVGKRVTKLTLNTKLKTLKNNQSFKLKVTFNKDSVCKLVKWTTTNKKIAVVNSKGKVTAKKNGKCYIKATAVDGSKKSAKCKITVK